MATENVRPVKWWPCRSPSQVSYTRGAFQMTGSAKFPCKGVGILQLFDVPGQVSYTRSDFLVNKDTMELDLADPKADALGMPHYTMTNMSHLGCCSNPWTHLLDSPNS